MELIIVDTETTGTDHDTDGVIEIGFVRYCTDERETSLARISAMGTARGRGAPTGSRRCGMLLLRSVA